MGAVYVATDERFGSTVAIKETLCMDDNFRKAIEREARLLNSLKHSALPRVSDHFEEENGQFLVMEYIAGDDVASILERDQKAFDVDQVLHWADSLLDALDYLHNQENPVIHRDIKPQNLKITPRGEIILLDFGLAKGNPTDAGHHTAAKSIFGYSRNYASLEQIQGTGTDPRSDLYSLAATLYHLLTNAPPEDALTRAMAVLSQRPDPLVPANVINPAVPRGVAGVLHMAMSLNADERPASAANMRQMLREPDKFGYLADPVTIQANAATTDLYGNRTRLMGDGTHADPRHTEAKTEVLPAYASQATSVRDAQGAQFLTSVASLGTTEAPQSRRLGRAILAVAAAVVLASTVGGIYLVNSASDERDRSPAEASTLPVAADVNTANANADVPVAATQGNSESAVAVAGAPRPETRQTEPQAERQSIDTRAEKKPEEPTRVEVDPKDFDIDVPDVKIQKGAAGEMIITKTGKDGEVITTRVPMPKPPPYGAPGGAGRHFEFPPGFDPQVLTPAQRQRLKQILQQNRNPRRVTSVGRPTPPAANNQP